MRKFRTPKDIFTNPSASICLTGFLAIVFQIALLKNHSAIHDFSMIKVAWWFVMSPIVFTLLVNNTKTFKIGRIQTSHTFKNYCLAFLLSIVISGVPFTSIRFAPSGDYHIENILHDVASYEQVYFSFTHDIPTNPPERLAVSRKQVYKVNLLNDVKNYFPRLNPSAKKVFLVDKKDEDKLSTEQKFEIENLSHYSIFYEDERCVIFDLEKTGVSK